MTHEMTGVASTHGSRVTFPHAERAASPARSLGLSGVDDDLPDEAVLEAVDEHRSNDLTSARARPPRHPFLVHDPITERDPVRDVVVQVRMLGHRLCVASPDLSGAVHQDGPGSVFDDDIWSIEGKASIEVVGVIGVDGGLDDLPRLRASSASWCGRSLATAWPFLTRASRQPTGLCAYSAPRDIPARWLTRAVDVWREEKRTAMEHPNAELLRRAWAAYDHGDEEGFAACLTDDWREYGPDGTDFATLADERPTMELHRSAFPDKHTEIHQIVADDEIVACHCTVTATHTGRYLDAEATGKRVVVQEMMFNRVRDGRLAITWAMTAGPGFYEQITGRTAPDTVDNLG
jgi:predicted ester cyclase